MDIKEISIFLITLSICFVCVNLTRPNIVFIIADDMGWNDVSFHGSDQIFTPNMDLLAYTGVALERYYSHCLCTPSRSALLTGKFAHVIGMQGYPLTNGEDRALPLDEKILPQYFKDLGYVTHLVGKWHVGLSRNEFLPTYRGFDTHFGHRGGYIDYYEYTLTENWSIGDMYGLDLYRNMTALWDAEGYITDLYTKEAKSIIEAHDISKPLFLMVGHNAPHSANEGAMLQAPPETVRLMRHIESSPRRIYGAMVKKLDESIGEIVKSLFDKGILDDTIIACVSDNGGITSGDSVNYASNWPLRGVKITPFEGGIRVNSIIWSKNLTQGHHLWKGYMHVSDWLPTLLTAVGAQKPANIDGTDLWDSIRLNQDSKRNHMYEIADDLGFSSIIDGDFKLITGRVNTALSNHQGGQLRGIIGVVPSYEQSLKESAMFSVISNYGIDFKSINLTLRDDIKVQCNISRLQSDMLCHPDNGKGCLFNIKEDPCEIRDLSASYPEIVEKLKDRLYKELQRTKPRTAIYKDPRAAPSLHNFTWNTWM